jgi:NitT/TauT family transport system substrate-binding protein
VTKYIKSHTKEALDIVNDQLKKYTGKALPDEVLRTSFGYMIPTYDPLAYTLEDAAYSAYKAGFLGDKEPDLKRICDLKPLNKVLKNMGLKQISASLNP